MEDEYGEVDEQALVYSFYMRNPDLSELSNEEALDEIKTWIECFVETPPKTKEEKADTYDNLIKSLFNLLVQNGRTPSI